MVSLYLLKRMKQRRNKHNLDSKISKDSRICPRCKSNDISPDFSIESYAKSSFFNNYKCNNCGYKGQFFPEIKRKE